MIDLPKRILLGKIKTPHPLAGITISGDGRTVVVASDQEPVLFLIDTGTESVRETIPLKDVPKPAQIARYSPNWSLLGVTSLNSDTVSLITPTFREQTAVKVGSQPMDMTYRGDELFVACQGDGSVHVIDIPARRWKQSFKAGTGCSHLDFFRFQSQFGDQVQSTIRSPRRPSAAISRISSRLTRNRTKRSSPRAVRSCWCVG